MQVKVVKADGSVEEYLCTKVIGTINNALTLAGEPNIMVAEELSDAVTYFLYSQPQKRRTTSSDILSMIRVVLAATSHEDAAVALGEYHYRRLLKRRRIEVVDAEIFEKSQDFNPSPINRWDKSWIIDGLMTKQKLDRQTARVIASMVEEKILNIGMTRVSRDLIKQLVLADTAMILQAQEQLQRTTVNSVFNLEQTYTDTDICFRQQQEGHCAAKL